MPIRNLQDADPTQVYSEAYSTQAKSEAENLLLQMINKIKAMQTAINEKTKDMQDIVVSSPKINSAKTLAILQSEVEDLHQDVKTTFHIASRIKFVIDLINCNLEKTEK